MGTWIEQLEASLDESEKLDEAFKPSKEDKKKAKIMKEAGKSDDQIATSFKTSINVVKKMLSESHSLDEKKTTSYTIKIADWDKLMSVQKQIPIDKVVDSSSAKKLFADMDKIAKQAINKSDQYVNAQEEKQALWYFKEMMAWYLAEEVRMDNPYF